MADDTEIPLRSYYADATPPEIVRVWEIQIRSAESIDAARLQVAYLQLLQLRTIKRILVWTLIVVPAVVAIILIINASQMDTGYPR